MKVKNVNEGEALESANTSRAQAALVCGLVMPISAIDGRDEAHWIEVQGILTDAVSMAGMEAKLVSDNDDSGIIHKRIVQNLYDNDVVVCDVSAKNPNVMFELGMRLAFDKPTVIVKDSQTAYSFDTSAIEHLEYPRDLRFGAIVDFKRKLSIKITAILAKGAENSFLKSFGSFKVPRIEHESVSEIQYLMDEMSQIKTLLRRQSMEFRPIQSVESFSDQISEFEVKLSEIGVEIEVTVPLSGSSLAHVIGSIKAMQGVLRVEKISESNMKSTFVVYSNHESYREVTQVINKLVSSASGFANKRRIVRPDSVPLSTP